ncbi:RES family NAD+ phosphorylase [Pontibacter harenae]|uniref:RES family NAD+ phosphorylase n=1 Tax=Pontibacter harenae TaxID=2894083 RepID=UPI001E394726|nr:RES family NAD+ phosphorylase [Pontibacter harenae]
MEVYRICLAKYAGELYASGIRGRWNSKGNFVIYTAGSRALACLENVVHRSGEGLSDNFKTVVITIPDDVTIESVSTDELPVNWQQVKSYPICQARGNEWYRQLKSAVLCVPSSIIPEEYNYILNTRHPDFTKIKITGTEDFFFDARIKANLSS